MLAPVASLVVLGAATVQSVREHRRHDNTGDADCAQHGHGHEPPGKALDEKKQKELDAKPTGIKAQPRPHR